MSGLTIYALSVQKGILALCEAPGRNGDYKDDLEHISDWKPSIVISVITAGEMVEFGAESFGGDVSDKGARWVHFPVADMQIPGPLPQDEDDERFDWQALIKTALATLNGGGRVLVHCAAGCGRSGMLALRLMIEAGESPERALKRLRTIRDCAVETDAQLEWACDVLHDADPKLQA